MASNVCGRCGYFTDCEGVSAPSHKSCVCPLGRRSIPTDGEVERFFHLRCCTSGAVRSFAPAVPEHILEQALLGACASCTIGRDKSDCDRTCCSVVASSHCLSSAVGLLRHDPALLPPSLQIAADSVVTRMNAVAPFRCSSPFCPCRLRRGT